MGLKGSKRKRAGREMPCELGGVWEAPDGGGAGFPGGDNGDIGAGCLGVVGVGGRGDVIVARLEEDS